MIIHGAFTRSGQIVYMFKSAEWQAHSKLSNLLMRLRLERLMLRKALDTHMAFQRAQWKVQRAGWAVMALIVMGAGAGLTGDGALSTTVIGSRDAWLTTTYERIARAGAVTEVRLSIKSDGLREGRIDDQLVLHVYGDVCRGMVMEGVSPEPVEQVAGAVSFTLVFRIADGALVRIRLRPSEVGWCRWSIDASAGDMNEEVGVSQLVLP